jgi:aminoglycoside/choline kinase family phosphotransferase
VDLSPANVNGLIAYFRELTRADGHSSAEGAAEYRRRFDLMALQRNLKALGTFGYQTTARGNTVYLQYIPRTLSYVKANLASYRRFDRLRELLAGTVGELR